MSGLLARLALVSFLLGVLAAAVDAWRVGPPQRRSGHGPVFGPEACGALVLLAFGLLTCAGIAWAVGS